MTVLMDVLVGLTGRAEMTVTEADSADALGSGDVKVLATSRLVELCERATVNAVRAALPEGWTAVAMRIRLDHLAPIRIGGFVAAEATVEHVDGRRLDFTVTASDAGGLVGAGKVTLVAVDRERFIEKVR